MNRQLEPEPVSVRMGEITAPYTWNTRRGVGNLFSHDARRSVD